MRDQLPTLRSWLDDGEQVAVATVVSVWGSAPRRPGSRMLVTASGQVAGSVSGGCVEGAVFEVAQRVLDTGTPELAKFGVSDEDAFAVGLSCGGEIAVFVEAVDPEDPVFQAAAEAVEEDRLAALVTVVEGPGAGRHMLFRPPGADGGDAVGSLGSEDFARPLEDAAAEAAQDRFLGFDARPVTVEHAAGESVLFTEALPPSPRLILVGAVHVAVSLVTFAQELGYKVWVVDPRSVFATPERFAHADGLLKEWPQDALPKIGLTENTWVAVLSHDEKFDVPALEIALAHPVRYVGALGSKRTHARRSETLRQRGVPQDAIDRIHAPIGLDLGGRRPEEIALAIVAEMVRVGHQR